MAIINQPIPKCLHENGPLEAVVVDGLYAGDGPGSPEFLGSDLNQKNGRLTPVEDIQAPFVSRHE
jgi:hypothetical protein